MGKKLFQLTIPFDFEEFRDIENYEGLYRISNEGKVYSVKRQKFLKTFKSNNGYLRVSLCKDKKQKNYYVHQLVAQAFIPNPLHLPQINHISEIKTDNHVSNLEWCSASYNCRFGTRNERIVEKLSKAVLQFTRQGELVNEYPSICEASRQTRINQGHISSCCLGKRKSAGKYVWQYKQKEEAA